MIGSLHTMSYLEPHDSFNKVFVWLKKTQKVNIKEQYEKYNVRAFDLHLYFIKENGRAIFKCGAIALETFSVYEILSYLNLMKNTYVRIVLEDKGDNLSDSKRKILESRFIEYCKMISVIYPNIKFFGGYRETDSKLLYNFENDAPNDLIFYKRVDKLNRLV